LTRDVVLGIFPHPLSVQWGHVVQGDRRQLGVGSKSPLPMHHLIRFAIAGAVFGTCQYSFAQSNALPSVPPLSPEASAGRRAQSLRLHAELASGVRGKSMSVEQALAKLRADSETEESGLHPQAAFGLAALNVAMSLVAVGEPGIAEEFFQSAERSLDIAVNGTDDRRAPEKAMLLEQLAFVRQNYLNKKAAALGDLDRAIGLLPNERVLQQRRNKLAGELEQVTRNANPKGK
jgi:hypothetical protein